MSYELDCKWHFAKLEANDGGEGPNSAMSQTFAQFPCASLIRESIQNSLDAVLDKDKPVKVCFEYRSLDKNDYPNFFGLKEHVESCLEYHKNIKAANLIYPPMISYLKDTNEVGFIRVSDYNTKGMDYEENQTDKTFYAFVRAAGVSVKEGDGSGGSFGFGKGAFFVMSPINTLIVSTYTQEGKSFFEGVTRLCSHKENGTRCSHIGFYDNNGGQPTSVPEKIPKPFQRDEPGTSIGIMGLNTDKWHEAKDELIKEVLRNFFVAIMKNKLIVVIDGHKGTENSAVMIDSSTISNLMTTYFNNTIDKRGNESAYNPRPYYEAMVYGECHEGNLETLGHVTLNIKEFEGNSTGIIFMRSLYMKVYRLGRNLGNYNGVFICDNENGNKILGDMEDPEHKIWEAENCRSSEKATDYATAQKAKKELDQFITATLENLLEIDAAETARVALLEKYLPSMDDVKGKGEKGNPFYGTPTGKYVQEGSSLTTEGSIKPQNINSKKNRKGQVTSIETGAFLHDPDGPITGGTGGRNGTSGGGTSGPGENFGPGVIEPQPGHFNQVVEVDWKPVVSKRKGYMDIVIYSENGIPNAELKFKIGREQASKSEDVYIKDSSKGTCQGLTITGVDISGENAKNIIQVAFSDNMSHSLILGVYENI